MGIEIRKMVRGKIPPVSFEKIAHGILGTRYELSLVVCGNALARTLNKKYRLPALRTSQQAGKRTYAPNVLSFPYDKHEGEIVLNAQKAEREARSLGIPHRERLAFLFIHGCLHLAGYKHGHQMEKLERDNMLIFGYPAK